MQKGLILRLENGWLDGTLLTMQPPGAETLELRVPRSQRLASYVLGISMHAKGSRLFLVRSGPDKMVNRPRFYTDEVVPQSGIYKVRHHKHRLPHEVTLLRDQYFPRCAQCDTAVMFELVRAVMDESETALFPRRICLYELPVIEDDTPIAG